MKKLLSILLLFASLGAFAQTYDTLPTGSKPYGNQLYLTPAGLIIGGTGSAKFRVIGTKKYVDSLLALKSNLAGGNSFTGDQSFTGKVSITSPTPVGAGNASSPLAVQGAAGGNNLATTGFAQAGNADEITILAGNGGGSVGNTSGTAFGGRGGSITLRAGSGGLATGATAFGGNAGNATLQAGTALSPGGLAGFAELKAGNADWLTGPGGNVFLTAGWGNFSSIDNPLYNGAIYLGVSNIGVVRGNTIIGANTDDKSNRLQVTGNSKFNGNTTFDNGDGSTTINGGDVFVGSKLSVPLTLGNDSSYNAASTKWTKELLKSKASLIGGKIPTTQLPDAILGSVNYQGNYNAATNSPALPAANGNKGKYYVVNVAGTQQGLNFGLGDWIISNGSIWEKVDNNNSVTSVAGKVGIVTLNKSDVELNNVDNTSDYNKPLSQATTLALANKAVLDGPNTYTGSQSGKNASFTFKNSNFDDYPLTYIDQNNVRVNSAINNYVALNSSSIFFQKGTGLSTVLNTVQPTGQRTITFPDASGTVALTSNFAAGQTIGANTTGKALGTSLQDVTSVGNTTNINLKIISPENTIPSLGNADYKLMLGNDLGAYGTQFGVLGNGNGFLQQGRTDGAPTAYNFLLNPIGGNVGIGTTTPSEKLEINGKVKAIAAGDVYGLTNGSISGGLGINPTAGFESVYLFANSNTPIRFGTNGTERVRLTADGNMGIGTTTPAAKLDINGDIKANNLSSGIYTPIAADLGNVSSVTPNAFTYIRIGNVVSVSGSASVINSQTGYIGFSLTLPIASNISNGTEVTGIVSAGTDYGNGSIQGSSGKAAISTSNFNSTRENVFYFNFQYQIK